MDNIIRLPEDRHDQAQLLLPWYATGRLDPTDRAMVETHLAQCSACRADLDAERALQAAMTELPVEAEQGWEALRRKLEVPLPAPAPPRERRRRWTASRRGKLRSNVLKWVVCAQSACLVALGAMLLSTTHTAPYRALGDAPTRIPVGNALVMFRPEVREADLRRMLNAGAVRLVDGPTAAGAYVVEVPHARRAAILAMLRADPGVTLAEPINGPPT